MNVRTLTPLALLVAAVVFAGCSGAPQEDVTDQTPEALNNGGGGGPPVWKSDPCADPNLKATVHDTNNDHVFVGTNGPDVIIGTDAHDVIWGNGGNDIICARGGADEIHGGSGDDYIDGGAGNDTIYGGDGDDVIHGRAGGDDIHGGAGDDILYGDLLDDTLWGDSGDDLLIGGHGTDVMHGGEGNDYLRGDTGNDSFFGGPGTDVASFMTAMPPGDPEPGFDHAMDGIDGEIVNFNDPCIQKDDPTQAHHQGCAYGDGKNEPLDDIEVIVGSPYNDHFISAHENHKFVGGFGDDKFDVPSKADVVDGEGHDTFHGQPFGKPGAAPAAGHVAVMVDNHARDFGLVVMGTTDKDHLVIHPNGKRIEVNGNDGTKLDAIGKLCHQKGQSNVICDVPHTLRYVAAYGGDGADHITLQGNFPRDFTGHINGGRDNDVLTGGDEQDVIFSGVTGNDWLYGNGGDDALLSESELTINRAKLKGQVTYTDGADHLFGGDGNDQLVSDFPCGGHEYSGGAGVDIAGFARSGKLPLWAQLAQWGDNPSIKTAFYGHAYNPQSNKYNGAYCDASQGTTLHPDLEVLEGSSADDVLYGNDNGNIIWGRQGDDEIHGLGGDDELFGLGDNDKIYGEAGNDVLHGGDGFDELYANDGQRDILLCEKGGGREMSADGHDEITGCKYH